jgi:predicted PurR-regulated permease PerM
MDESETATTTEARPQSVAAESYRRASDGGHRSDSTFRKLRPLVVLCGVALITVVLYFGRPVLMPIALATLLTFLLTPLVNGLQRVGLGRVLPVVVVVALMFSLLGGIGWTLATQITSLSDELPKYRGNIRQKIADLRGAQKGTAIDKLQHEAREVMGELQKGEPATASRDRPVPVVVQERSMFWHLPTVLELIASAGLVLVLVIFMLIRREEMRNRILRLAGYGRLPTATRALDEASQRVSRYLLTQCLVNGGFGIAVALGLFAIGVPYAFLWGFLAACLRFIPYVGTWLAALMPVTLGLAVFHGWQRPLLVIALFLVLEPFIYMVLEPLLYGQSAGVSEVGLLVAVAFWTWVWGPIGLILATPLTVCLVVFAKYVPELEFIVVLMGDEPVMETKVSFYQRLLAMDQDDAMRLVDAALKTTPREEIYDAVLVPALSFARRDRARGRLTEDEERAVLLSAREVVDDLDGGAAASHPAPSAVCVLACPAQDEADVLSLVMLHDLVAGYCHVEIVSPDLLGAEVADLVERTEARVVCIAALPPSGLSRARYLCKRLRARFPELRILVGRWAADDDRAESTALLLSAGADAVHASLLETRDELLHLSAPRAGSDVAPTLDAPLGATGTAA